MAAYSRGAKPRRQTQLNYLFSDDDLQLTSSVTYAMLPDCECGCSLNQSSGYIITSTSTYCPSARVWTIRVHDGLLVRLKFIRINIQNGILRVRDGNLPLSNLLLQSDARSTTLPQPLVSAGNILRVEFILPTGEVYDTELTDGGFAARFLAVRT